MRHSEGAVIVPNCCEECVVGSMGREIWNFSASLLILSLKMISVCSLQHVHWLSLCARVIEGFSDWIVAFY